jgi:hypothetical protein
VLASAPESEPLTPSSRLLMFVSWLSSGSGVAAGAPVGTGAGDWLVAADPDATGESATVATGVGAFAGAVATAPLG